jgi:hypothetical protein
LGKRTGIKGVFNLGWYYHSGQKGFRKKKALGASVFGTPALVALTSASSPLDPTQKN